MVVVNVLLPAHELQANLREALVEAYSVIVKLRKGSLEALLPAHEVVVVVEDAAGAGGQGLTGALLRPVRVVLNIFWLNSTID